MGLVNSQASSGPPGPAFVKSQFPSSNWHLHSGNSSILNLDFDVVGKNIVPSRYASVCCS